MKLLHMADIHLDSALSTHLDRERRAVRRQEMLAAFVRVVEYAKVNNIKAVLIAGDLFDSAIVSNTTSNVVYRSITNNADIDFYYLKGNHDINSFLANIDMVPKNLHMFSDEWTSYELTRGIKLYGMEIEAGNKENLYEGLKLDTGDYNIVTLHGQLGEYESKGSQESIALNRLVNKGIDYLALGHVHEYSCEKMDSRGIWCYPGCLEPRGFDECGVHGFCVLDIDENTHQYEHEFIQINTRSSWEIDVDISGCSDSVEVIDEIANNLKDDISGSDMVKLVLTGTVRAESEINTDYIYEYYKNRFYFLKLINNAGISIDASGYEYDQSLRGEFVRSVRADLSISDEQKGEIIKRGLQILMGETV